MHAQSPLSPTPPLRAPLAPTSAHFWLCFGAFLVEIEYKFQSRGGEPSRCLVYRRRRLLHFYSGLPPPPPPSVNNNAVYNVCAASTACRPRICIYFYISTYKYCTYIHTMKVIKNRNRRRPAKPKAPKKQFEAICSSWLFQPPHQCFSAVGARLENAVCPCCH